jgi:hypothetical protein
MSLDYDGTEVGFAVAGQARQAAAETQALSGDIVIGNRSNGISPFHGGIMLVWFPFKLSDAQRAIAEAFMLAQMREIYQLSVREILGTTDLGALATNTATGARQSMMVGGSGRGTDDAKDELVSDGVTWLGVSAGATLLINSVVSGTGWSKSGAGSASASGDVLSLDRSAGSVAWNAQFASTVAANYTWAFRYRVTASQGAASSGDVLRLRDTGGTSIDQETINTDGNWHTVVLSGAAVGTSTRCSIILSGTLDQVDIEFDEIRATATSAPMPAAPAGSAVGYVYAEDYYTVAPTWQSAGTLFFSAIPYGYSSGDNPANNACRFTDTENRMDIFWGSGVVVRGTHGTPVALISGYAVEAGVPFTASFDWDCATHGGRVNDVARGTAASTDIPSGGLALGNAWVGTRPTHAAGSWHLANRVLSDLEYTALAREITATAPVLTAGAAA